MVKKVKIYKGQRCGRDATEGNPTYLEVCDADKSLDGIMDESGRQPLRFVKYEYYAGDIVSWRPFPDKLIIPCIKAGCHENGIVLDPFMGAGTTAVVARKLGRKYIGFELNGEYVKMAEDRLAEECGIL